MSTRSRERTVAAVARDAVSDVFGVDGLLWTTLSSLVRQPGALADAYARGQDVAALRPTRVYLLASVALFAVLRATDPGGAAGEALRESERRWLASANPNADRELAEDLARQSRETRALAEHHAARADDLDSPLAQVESGARPDVRQRAAGVVTSPAPAPDVRERRGTEEELAAAQGEIIGALLRWLPIALIVAVPLYALGLFVLAGGERSGVAALALAAHAHAATYGALAVAAAASWAAGWSGAAVAASVGAALLVGAAWQARALRRVYGVTRLRAVLVAVGLGSAYVVAVAGLGVILYGAAIQLTLNA